MKQLPSSIILQHRSLILLDEIGSGTSTYDGISIAWSIAEHLHNSPHQPKTLFATHYHELNELEEKFSRVKNYHITNKEVGNKIIFLRKLAPGGSTHSFGIHVARMAGMPPSLIDRANEILKQLESKHVDEEGSLEVGSQKSEVKSQNIASKVKSLSCRKCSFPFLMHIAKPLMKSDNCWKALISTGSRR